MQHAIHPPDELKAGLRGDRQRPGDQLRRQHRRGDGEPSQIRSTIVATTAGGLAFDQRLLVTQPRQLLKLEVCRQLEQPKPKD